MNTRTVVESINSPKPPDNNYQLMLRESVGHFLAEYKKGCSDFSGFGSIFFRLLQKTTDPPLEITWFYSAMNFHSSVKSTLEEDPLKKVIIAAKDLFQLLVSCSSPCNGLKKVAVLAPVMYELYYVASNCSNEGFCLKKEIGGLVEVIVSYISLCCSNYLEEWENGSENLSDGFEDLIRVWTVDRTEVNCEFDCNSTVFFPLVSGKNRSQVGVGCRVGYLAGVVMVEAFFLSLYLKFGWGVLREELLKDMRSWAVQTITGFQNSCFFDMLLKVLLEPSLPVTTLLSSEDEALLREVLYDVVILVDYSFLKSDIWTQLPGDYLKNFALTWLLVADNAVQFARECCDQTRAVSYMDAFSKSCLPYQLIEWVTNHTGPEKNISRPNISTPKSLIRWFLVLEDQQARVFDHNISKLHAREAICKSKIDYETLKSKSDCENLNGSIQFGSGNTRSGQDKVDEDQEMVDWLDDAFVPDYCVGQQFAVAERRMKRKEGRPDEGETTRFKLTKFNFDEGLVGETCLPRHDDNLSGGNEVEIQSMI